MDLIIFPGNNTSIKRYRSYFPKYNLYSPREITLGDKPNVILCHSIGILNALNYCIKHNIIPTIICMDGVEIKDPIPENIRICMFRPIDKFVESDINYEVIRYKIDDDENRHHPYRVKKIRDQIVKEINKFDF